MKFGINLLLWTGNFETKQVDLFPKMKEMGYDGVELPVIVPDDFNTATVKKALEDSGLGCTFCTVIPNGMSLIDPDAGNRQTGVDNMKHIIDLAAAVNCETICGPMYSPVGYLAGRGRTDEEWDFAVECYKKIMPHAEQANVKIAIEPLNRFETYFLNIDEDVCKFLDEVGSSQAGLHYDTFHANIEEKDPVAAIKTSAAKINHVHFSENDRGIVGSGHVPWQESADALKAIGYDSWVTVESFLPALKELAAAAAIWRELAPSGEVLAQESLDYMKKLF